ncbi:MAG TPA: hypothetical protein VFQ25_06815 [Ktedonobacterales bacterium]|nr:hypothetical protein [Ktedonobacterales bacterium]
MRHEGDGSPMMLLWWSTAGFAVLTGMLTFADLLLISVTNHAANLAEITPTGLLSALINLALPAMPGAVLSWWLLIIVPRRSSAFAGCCAGLLTVALAVLGVCLFGVFFGQMLWDPATSLPVWEKLEAALFFWLFGLMYLLVQGWGWEMLLVGAVAGALYGALVGALARRRLPPIDNGQPAPNPMLTGSDP